MSLPVVDVLKCGCFTAMEGTRVSQNPEDAGGANSESPVPSCIRFFRKGNNDRLLIAAVEPSDDFPAGIAIDAIQEWVHGQGCRGWFLYEETISRLSREVRKLEKAKEYTVAERKDCSIEVHIAPDRLKAWIRVSPAFGGESLTETVLRRALGEHHICFGVKEDKLQQIVQNGECEKEMIAEGVPPVQGEKAQFEPLVVESAQKGIPQERENGTVDYKNLGLFLSVTKGTPLLRRIPPTMGTPGTGVDGASIPAPRGIDRPPHSGAGTTLSKEDPDIIVATRAGQPFFMDNSARVDPTLEIDAVNPSTGNVIFDGNIIVRGAVESGFTVSAGQDLTILDTVEGADLSAGKNLVLLTGAYGKGNAKISAKGNLEARFLSDCTVYCRGDIEVADLMAHCAVECEGAVRLGKYGGKGQFFGGKLLALREIQAQILGSVSEAVTLVEVGPPRAMILRQAEIDKDLVATRQELEIAQKQIQSIENSSSGADQLKSNNLKQKAADLAEKLNELQKEQENIRTKLNAPHKGKIRAAQVHRGVILCIGKLRQPVSDLMSDICLQLPVEEKPSQ